MRYTRVREHLRKLPGQAKKKKDSLSNRIMLFACFGVLIFFALYYVLYLISRIPIQVFYEFFGAIFVVVVVFIAFTMYRFQRKLRPAMKNEDPPAQVHYQRQTMPQPMAYYEVQGQHYQATQRQSARIDSLDSVLDLTPKEFEEFVGSLLSAIGYLDVQITGKSGDLGVDVSAKDAEGNDVIVQCKRFGRKNAVTSRDMRDFLGTITIHNNAKGIYVTTSRFTGPARAIAKTHSIRLIDGDLLLKWIQNTRRTL